MKLPYPVRLSKPAAIRKRIGRKLLPLRPAPIKETWSGDYIPAAPDISRRIAKTPDEYFNEIKAIVSRCMTIPPAERHTYGDNHKGFTKIPAITAFVTASELYTACLTAEAIFGASPYGLPLNPAFEGTHGAYVVFGNIAEISFARTGHRPDKFRADMWLLPGYLKRLNKDTPLTARRTFAVRAINLYSAMTAAAAIAKRLALLFGQKGGGEVEVDIFNYKDSQKRFYPVSERHKRYVDRQAPFVVARATCHPVTLILTLRYLNASSYVALLDISCKRTPEAEGLSRRLAELLPWNDLTSDL